MSVQYVAIPTDGGAYLAHFGRARSMAVFGIEDGQVISGEDRLNPDPEHLDRAHHRIMLDLVRDCQVVLTSHIGPPMIASLAHLGIKVLGAPTESVHSTLDAYLRSVQGGPPLEEVSR
ncbi:MAG TPA: NifB/NifX family molybdenum-iron cluster-binding protein [Chloroflexota bacterium]